MTTAVRQSSRLQESEHVAHDRAGDRLAVEHGGPEDRPIPSFATAPPSSDEIRAAILSIEGYTELKKELLAGEVERFRRTLALIQPVRGGSLIDLGSSGDLVPIYQSMLGFDRVCCLDTIPEDGSHVLRHANGTRFSFETRQINLERDPYPLADESFDQGVAMEVIEHLAIDPMFLLSEANRVLKRGAELVLTTPNIISLSCLYHMIWGRHPALGKQAFGPGTMDRHHREYAPDDIAALVEAAGFRIRTLDTFDARPPGSAVRHIERLLHVLRRLRPGIDVSRRGSVIRCACVKAGPVVERFPEKLYPRYRYYDYAAYDRELTERFQGNRYWRTNVCS